MYTSSVYFRKLAIFHFEKSENENAFEDKILLLISNNLIRIWNWIPHHHRIRYWKLYVIRVLLAMEPSSIASGWWILKFSIADSSGVPLFTFRKVRPIWIYHIFKKFITPTVCIMKVIFFSSILILTSKLVFIFS